MHTEIDYIHRNFIEQFTLTNHPRLLASRTVRMVDSTAQVFRHLYEGSYNEVLESTVNIGSRINSFDMDYVVSELLWRLNLEYEKLIRKEVVKYLTNVLNEQSILSLQSIYDIPIGPGRWRISFKYFAEESRRPGSLHHHYLGDYYYEGRIRVGGVRQLAGCLYGLSQEIRNELLEEIEFDRSEQDDCFRVDCSRINRVISQRGYRRGVTMSDSGESQIDPRYRTPSFRLQGNDRDSQGINGRAGTIIDDELIDTFSEMFRESAVNGNQAFTINWDAATGDITTSPREQDRGEQARSRGARSWTAIESSLPYGESPIQSAIDRINRAITKPACPCSRCSGSVD